MKRRLFILCTILSTGVLTFAVIAGLGDRFEPSRIVLDTAKWVHALPSGVTLEFRDQSSRDKYGEYGGPIARSYSLFGVYVARGYEADALAAPRANGPPTVTIVVISYGLIALVAAILPSIAVTRFIFIGRPVRKRLAEGRCPACGYDLRATPERCPECGTASSTTHQETTEARP